MFITNGQDTLNTACSTYCLKASGEEAFVVLAVGLFQGSIAAIKKVVIVSGNVGPFPFGSCQQVVDMTVGNIYPQQFYFV